MGHTSKIIHPIPCEWLLALVHKSRMVGSSPVSTSGIILLSVGPEGEINHQILPIKSPEKIPIPISLIYDATNHINNDRNHTEKIHIIHIDPSRFTIIKIYICSPSTTIQPHFPPVQPWPSVAAPSPPRVSAVPAPPPRPPAPASRPCALPRAGPPRS